MAERDLTLRVDADTSGLTRGLDKVDRSMARTGGKMDGTKEKFKKWAAVAGAAVAAAAIKFGADAVQLASDTDESLSKVRTVFGSGAGAVEKFASGSAKSLGVSRKSALDAAGQFGNLFDQLGIVGPQAAGMSTKMIALASDLGSFNNADPSEVLDSMQSAFRGEYDALQKFIPTASAATVEQAAMAATGKKSAKELTAGEKAAAVYAVMLKGAGKASGDFARTSGGLANQQRIAKARFEDLQGSIGAKLLPVVVKLAGFLNDSIIPALQKVADFLSRNVTWVGPLAAALVTLAVGFKLVAVGTALWNAALAANPVGLIIAGVIALGVGLVVAYKKIGWFRDAVNAVWKGIQVVAKVVFRAIVIYLTPMKIMLQVAWRAAQLFAQFAVAAFTRVMTVGRALANALRVAFGLIRSVAASVAGSVKTVWSSMGAALSSVGARIGGVMHTLGNVLRIPLRIAQSVASGIRSAFDSVLRTVTGVARSIGNVASGIANAIKRPINAVIRGINAIGINVPKLTIGGGSILGHKLPEVTVPGTGRRIDPIPHIPELAAGGIIRGSASGTLVVAGERGRDEAIVPLGGSGIGTTINVTVNVPPTADPIRTGREVVRAIAAFERVSGAQWRGA